jgi:SAM-dependent methyltransferase
MSLAVSVSDRWNEEAEAWIRWARAPDVDHFFWRLALPELLALVPAPGRLTVDVGCGEGRFARELLARGHTVLGVEHSPVLAEAARAASPPIEVVVADAAAMPLDDGVADLAVASMSLLNIADLDGAMVEIARVLAPGGRFAFAVVHPLRSIGSARELLGPSSSYFDELHFAETRSRDGVTMTFHDVHRPLSQLFAAFAGAGLAVETLREPVPSDEHVAAHPAVAQWRTNPCLLFGRAVKPPLG